MSRVQNKRRSEERQKHKGEEQIDVLRVVPGLRPLDLFPFSM